MAKQEEKKVNFRILLKAKLKLTAAKLMRLNVARTRYFPGCELLPSVEHSVVVVVVVFYYVSGHDAGLKTFNSCRLVLPNPRTLNNKDDTKKMY